VNCRECAEFLWQYVAGELAPEAHEVFTRHLAKCRNCDIYLEQYRLTISAGKKACAREDESAPPIPDELVRAILTARKT
jgi:anti-sigma factor RsiW